MASRGCLEADYRLADIPSDRCLSSGNIPAKMHVFISVQAASSALFKHRMSACVMNVRLAVWVPVAKKKRGRSRVEANIESLTMLCIDDKWISIVGASKRRVCVIFRFPVR